MAYIMSKLSVVLTFLSVLEAYDVTTGVFPSSVYIRRKIVLPPVRKDPLHVQTVVEHLPPLLRRIINPPPLIRTAPERTEQRFPASHGQRTEQRFLEINPPQDLNGNPIELNKRTGQRFPPSYEQVNSIIPLQDLKGNRLDLKLRSPGREQEAHCAVPAKEVEEEEPLTEDLPAFQEADSQQNDSQKEDSQKETVSLSQEDAREEDSQKEEYPLSQKEDLSLSQEAAQQEDSTKEDSKKEEHPLPQKHDLSLSQPHPVKSCPSIVITNALTGKLLYEEEDEEDDCMVYCRSIEELAMMVTYQGLETGKIKKAPEGYETKITFMVDGNSQPLDFKTRLRHLFKQVGTNKLNLTAVVSTQLWEEYILSRSGMGWVRPCEAVARVGKMIENGKLDLNVGLDMLFSNLQKNDNGGHVAFETIWTIKDLVAGVPMRSNSDQNIAARARIIDVYLEYIKYGEDRYYGEYRFVFSEMVYQLQRLNVAPEKIFEHLLACLERDIISRIVQDADRRRRKIQGDYSFYHEDEPPNCSELMRVIRNLRGISRANAVFRINQVFIRGGKRACWGAIKRSYGLIRYHYIMQ